MGLVCKVYSTWVLYVLNRVSICLLSKRSLHDFCITLNGQLPYWSWAQSCQLVGNAYFPTAPLLPQSTVRISVRFPMIMFIFVPFLTNLNTSRHNEVHVINLIVQAGMLSTFRFQSNDICLFYLLYMICYTTASKCKDMHCAVVYFCVCIVQLCNKIKCTWLA